MSAAAPGPSPRRWCEIGGGRIWRCSGSGCSGRERSGYGVLGRGLSACLVWAGFDGGGASSFKAAPFRSPRSFKDDDDAAALAKVTGPKLIAPRLCDCIPSWSLGEEGVVEISRCCRDIIESVRFRSSLQEGLRYRVTALSRCLSLVFDDGRRDSPFVIFNFKQVYVRWMGAFYRGIRSSLSLSFDSWRGTSCVGRPGSVGLDSASCP